MNKRSRITLQRLNGRYTNKDLVGKDGRSKKDQQRKSA